MPFRALCRPAADGREYPFTENPSAVSFGARRALQLGDPYNPAAVVCCRVSRPHRR
jgi:hypothetical protein